MATTDTNTTDLVLTDDALELDTTNDSFGKEIAKTLVISAASTAAMIGGVVAVGFAAGKFQEFRTKRAAKKAEPEVHVVTDLPENPKTEN